MASTVVGLYDDHSTAETVYRMLESEGLSRDELHMVSHEKTDLSGWSAGSRNWDKGGFGHDVADRLTDLHVPSDEAQLYSEGVRRGGTLLVARVDDSRAQRAADIMNMHKPVDIQTRRSSWQQRGFSNYDRTAMPFNQNEVMSEREHVQREESIPVVEENLAVGKREVQRGGVRVHSRVVSTPVEETIRLRNETVDVERRNVTNRPITDADQLFQERTIEMTETDEEAVVAKQAQVTGEVVVRKGAEEHVETIRDTVRRTDVEVEQIAGGATMGGARGSRFEDHSNDFQSHCNTSFGNGSWSTYEPAYRYGHTASSDARYSGRNYNDVEMDLRRDYETRHGSGTWDKVRGAVQHSFTRGRGTGTGTGRL